MTKARRRDGYIVLLLLFISVFYAASLFFIEQSNETFRQSRTTLHTEAIGVSQCIERFNLDRHPDFHILKALSNAYYNGSLAPLAYYRLIEALGLPRAYAECHDKMWFRGV